MAVAGRAGFGTSTEYSSRTCWILLKATKAVLRAETGVGVPFYHAGAVAEFDPASWTSGAGAAGAVTATALAVLLTRLPGALTLVGSSLTDAQRSKRATDDGSPHQPEGLASREGAICQSTGEIVEEAFFSGHPPPLPRKTGLVSPAELRNVVKYEGLQDLAQLLQRRLAEGRLRRICLLRTWMNR